MARAFQLRDRNADQDGAALCGEVHDRSEPESMFFVEWEDYNEEEAWKYCDGCLILDSR